MIRIPTGIAKNKARTIALLTGLAAIGLSFVPALSAAAPALWSYGLAATGLGTTLGRAGVPQSVRVPK